MQQSERLESIKTLDYIVEGNLITPTIFMDNDQFDQLIEHYDNLEIKTFQRRRRA